MFVNVYFIESDKRLSDSALLEAIIAKIQKEKSKTDTRRMITVFPDSMSSDCCLSIKVDTNDASNPQLIFRKAQEEVRS